MARILGVDLGTRRIGLALCGLAAWAALEGWLALTPWRHPDHPTLASLPLLSLALGAAGALAIVVTAALIVRLGGPIAEAILQGEVEKDDDDDAAAEA